MATKNMQKKQTSFLCKTCDYKCNSKFLWNQHCATKKHISLEKMSTNICTSEHTCNFCGKSYKQRSGLWRHKKSCGVNKDIDIKELMQSMISNNEMKDEMFGQLKEQTKIIQELIPKLGNNNNNKFNINVFLNEQCSEAINMSDFIESLEIHLKDLRYTKDNGLIEGVSSVLVNGLRSLEMYKRPIHCTDMKRETLYIKDNNEWDRENCKDKLKHAIGDVANKQRKAIIEWETQHPHWAKSEKGKDEYISIVRTLMSDVNMETNENKIIKTIAKETIIEK
tara:strand:- start:12150 stop:12989 length:840 start_codon:yes stop_codon:yes gene_type:complete